MGRDTNFYYSFLVLPAAKRRAIVAVWDFCRAVDDAVDEPAAREAGGEGPAGEAAASAAARRALGRWRAEVDAVFSGRPAATPQGRALAPLVARYGLPRASFDALIDGVEMDLGERRYETFEALHGYCLRVASAVGLICLEIFGYRDPKAREYATDLGVALQLTNILRDVPEDLARGRVYIPLEDFRACGCTEDDLRAEIRRAGGGVRSPSVKQLLRIQAERAHDYYARAAAARPRRDARRLAAAEIMGAVYRAILRQIERADYDVFSRTIRLPRARRAAIAASTWARTVLRL